MEDQAEFFSPKHKQALSIATWAKYIAWIALAVSIISPITGYVGALNFYQSVAATNGLAPDFLNELKHNPAYAFSVLVNVLNRTLVGLAYFLVLQGISLGLNMIVETDINYRELRQEGEQDE
jgi:hypothetical protein